MKRGDSVQFDSSDAGVGWKLAGLFCLLAFYQMSPKMRGRYGRTGLWRAGEGRGESGSLTERGIQGWAREAMKN